jgi:NADPH:quinone reductase-like Zn-dependent oxidoreductase
VNGGSGSLGTFVVQFLQVLGASVAATTSTAHVERLTQLGVARVIDYSREDVLESVRAWAPDGVDSIIDAVGLETLPRNTPDCIKAGGILVCISNLITDTDYFDIASAAKRNVRVADNVRGSPTANTPLFQMEGFHQIVAGVGRGAIKVPPYKVLPLTEAAKAHEEVESGHFRHKILLHIADL